jgi:hypothetical protein
LTALAQDRSPEGVTIFRRKPRWILLLPLTGLLLIIAATGYVFWQLRPAADGWNADNLVGSMTRLMLSKSPEMQSIRDHMATAYVDLDEQKKLARAEGIPLSASDILLRHVPDDRNAAVPSRKLWEALQAKPLPDGIKTILDKGPVSDADARTLTSFFNTRPELLPVVASIAARPVFSLNRTWTPEEIANVGFEPLTALRAAARLLRARAFLFTREGHYADAMAVNRQALKLAAFAFSEEGLIPWLIGRATEAVALQSIQSTLVRAGTAGGVPEMVKQAIQSLPPLPSVAELIRFEALDGYIRAPKDKIRSAAPGPPEVIPAPRGKNPFSHGRLEAAGLAEYLRQMRLTLAAVRSPDPMRSAPMQEMIRILSGQIPPTPASLYADILVPRVSRVLRRAAESQARRNITLAAAEALTHKARTGSFPASLPSEWRPGPLRPAVEYNHAADGFTLSATIREKDFADGFEENKPDTEFRFAYPTR